MSPFRKFRDLLMKLHGNEEKYDDDVINVAELDIANSLLSRVV